MRLFVLPISGGRFPVQLSGIIKLIGLDIKPDLILASSGGAVASYVSSAGRWDINDIMRVAYSLDSRLFIRSWFSPGFDFVHSAIAGFFYGSIYRSSDITFNFFKTYFTPSTIVKTEIWVGAVNMSSGSICLFCNRDRDSAQIKGEYFSSKMFKSEPLKYLDGDMYKIMDAAMASASIPLMVEPKVIDDRSYIDCGTKFASPLTPMQDEIYNIAKTQELHIFYINGIDIEADIDSSEESVSKYNMYDGSKLMTDHVVRGFIIHDRMTSYEIIKSNSMEVPNYIELSIEHLPAVVLLIELCRHSLIEIYPVKCYTVKLTTFTGEDVIKAIKYTELGLRIWWSGNSNLFNNLR